MCAASDQLSAELVGAFTALDTALRAADSVSDEVLDPGRVELLTTVRRQLDGARREHLALLEDCDDARLLARPFREKATRLRDGADLDHARRRVDAIRASSPSAVEPVRALAARWEARTSQPVRLPAIVWPKGTDAFAPPTLTEEK